jgi:hypothetical protein
MGKTYLKAILVCSLAFVWPVSLSQLAVAGSGAQPNVISFTMSPASVDVTTSNNSVTFDLQVSNPTGIASTQTLATFTNGTGISLTIPLIRTDTPVSYSLQNVEFKGTLVLPSSMQAGVYSGSANPIFALNSDGSTGYPTPALVATSASELIGASNAIQVRVGGDLNFSYQTFIGPSFNKSISTPFLNPKYNFLDVPIWKVGESINLSDYYELKIPNLALKLKSKSSGVCTSNGTNLSLIAVGVCEFTVYTDKTLDYQYRQDVEVVNVTSARTKPIYVVGSIPNQNSTALPLQVNGPFIYGPLGLVVPATATPSVCFSTGVTITIISGGTCTLNYYSPASPNYLASDIFPLTFQISRTSQALNFLPPSTVSLASKTLPLIASSSSGGAVVLTSETPSICSVTGNSLNLIQNGICQVRADQMGSTTIAPVSSVSSILITSPLTQLKKLVCVKNAKMKFILGTKCPVGFKVKK